MKTIVLRFKVLFFVALISSYTLPTFAGDLLIGNFFTNEIKRFDQQTGGFINTFVTSGQANEYPGMVFGADGDLYVSNRLNSNVERYDSQTGNPLNEFVTTASGGLSGPSFLVFGPDGHLYVSSVTSNQVLRYDGQTGVSIDVFADGNGLNRPLGLSFGPDGNLYVASSGSGEILRFNGATGVFIDIFSSSGLRKPAGIDFGPDGNLYVINAATNLLDDVANKDSNLVSIDGQTGAGIEILINTGGFSSLDLKFGPDDLLYVTSFLTNEVLRYRIDNPGRLAFDSIFIPAGHLDGAATIAFFLGVTPKEIWGRQDGTVADDQATAVAVGDGNNVYVAGTTDGTFSGQASAGGQDAFIRKYDATGQLLCTHQFGTSGDETVSGIKYAAPNVYVSGGTSGTFADNSSTGGTDLYVRQYDLNCHSVWTQQFGSSGNDQPGSGLGLTPDESNLFVSYISDSGPTPVAHIQKLDALGGGLSCASLLDEFLAPLNSITLNSPMVTIALTTEQDNFASGGTGGEISQFDLNCNPTWSASLGTAGEDNITGLGAGPLESNPEYLFVGGDTDAAFDDTVNIGATDLFVQRYDYNTGTLDWTRQFGTFGIEQGSITLNSPFLWVSGTTTGAFSEFENAGGKDVIIRKFDLDGNEIWTSQFGTDQDDEIGAMAKTPDAASVIVVGNTSGAFLGKVNKGGKDFFVKRLKVISEPSDLLTALIDLVSDSNVHHGIANSLDAKLDAAKDSLTDLNNNNDVAAKNALAAFISAVEAQRGKKISDADADKFIADTQAILDILEDV